MDLLVYILASLCSISVVLSQRLVQVNILYRHGDRSPTRTFPTDVYQESAWPRGWGQLSRRGQERHLRLGKFFRRRYDKFLGKRYHPDLIYVRSTDVDRTLMSAQADIAGIFPPMANETWTSEITNWQPLPIHTVPHSMDNVLIRGNNCPRYDAMCRELWTTRPTPEVVVETTKYAEFWRDVKRNAGLSPDTRLEQVWYIPDALYIEKCNGFTLPNWVDDSVYRHLVGYHNLNFKMMVYNDTLARLAGGNLLNEIQNNMRSKLNGGKTRSMYVYSAHDDTVAPLLAAMKVYNDIAPPYASAVILELWENDAKGGPFVRVYYRNDTSINPQAPLHLTIPGCTADCPWSLFVELTRSSIPRDYAKECQMPPGTAHAERIYDTHPSSTQEDDLDGYSIIDGKNVPSIPPSTSPDSSGLFVFGCIFLILSGLFIVCFSLFVFLRAYKIQIVVQKDPATEPLLRKL